MPNQPTVKPRIAVIGISAGNFLEMYNFSAYAFFSPMIAHAFFPAANHLTSLLMALVVYGAGFLSRPAGAIAFGRYEKRHGRRAALLLTFSIMAAGTAILAATPDYARIGLAAPLLVTFARLLQGFSEGGEVGPATTLLVDMARPGRRAHYAVLQILTQMVAGLVAVLAGSLLSGVLSHTQLYGWGWRVPFVLGLSIVPMGMYLRRSIHDDHRVSAQVIASSALTSAVVRRVLLAMLIMAAGTIGNYVRLYGVSYSIVVLHLPPQTGMAAMAAGLVAAILGMGLGLRLGRTVPPRRLFIRSSVLSIAVIYPVYHLVAVHPGLPTLVLLNVAITGIGSLPAGIVTLALLDALPAARRSAYFGLVSAVAISIFGGATQPLITWIIRDTGDIFVPCWVLLATSAITLIAMLKLGIKQEEERYAAPVAADLLAK
jgi:MFS transporter, MHS family, proline/betaine transporter